MGMRCMAIVSRPHAPFPGQFISSNGKRGEQDGRAASMIRAALEVEHRHMTEAQPRTGKACGIPDE